MQTFEWFQHTTEWLVENASVLAVNLVVAILILLVGKFLIRALCRITRGILSRSARVSQVLENFIVDVLHKVLWGFVGMIVLSQVGINIVPLIAGLGIAGFILGFAFQETLGNLAAGLMVLLNQPFKIGEYIETGGIAGTVQDLNLMATTLTTPDNKRVIVPNRAIWGTSIVNYSSMDTRRVDLKVGISYTSDIGKACELISGLLKADDRVLDEPVPVVEVFEMADSSVNLVVRPWCKTPDYWPLYFSLNRTIKETLDRDGIEIPFPQLDVHHHGLPGKG